MDNPLLRLLNPTPMQNQRGSGAMPIMPQPQMQAPQMQQRPNGLNFMRDLVAGALLSYGGAGISPVLMGQQNRRRQMEDMQEQAQAQQQQNATKAWLKSQGREDLVPLVDAGQADVALRVAMQKQEAPTPYTDIGKVKRDLEAGLITPEEAQQIISGQGGTNEYAQREQAAAQYGLVPGSPAYQAFILTGKMPREDQAPLTATDKKAILEADDMVAANEAAVSSLGRAQELSPKANSGFLAGPRTWLGNTLPDVVVPDFIASPESSLAAANLDNEVMGQALASMKSIFGGNPTEGERQILLELQASSSMTKPQRAAVLKRAQDLAQRRLEFNKQRAAGLRGGEYYQPGGGAPAGSANGWTIEQVD
jgi:hypothetical protein